MIPSLSNCKSNWNQLISESNHHWLLKWSQQFQHFFIKFTNVWLFATQLRHPNGSFISWNHILLCSDAWSFSIISASFFCDHNCDHTILGNLQINIQMNNNRIYFPQHRITLFYQSTLCHEMNRALSAIFWWESEQRVKVFVLEKFRVRCSNITRQHVIFHVTAHLSQLMHT